MGTKKIGIANDHAGFELKGTLKAWLAEKGYEVVDFGCYGTESCNYAIFAHTLGYAIDSGEVEMGITICGSGNGISMAVNKHPKVRAALCWRESIAILARSHNDANVCSIPARFVSVEEAITILERFLSTPFEGGRHAERVASIPL